MEINYEICKKCKYYWDDSGGGWINNSKASSQKYSLCSYYMDTGQHRFEDFPKKHTEEYWMTHCDRFEECDGPRRVNLRREILKRKGITASQCRRMYREI